MSIEPQVNLTQNNPLSNLTSCLPKLPAAYTTIAATQSILDLVVQYGGFTPEIDVHVYNLIQENITLIKRDREAWAGIILLARYRINIENCFDNILALKSASDPSFADLLYAKLPQSSINDLLSELDQFTQNKNEPALSTVQLVHSARSLHESIGNNIGERISPTNCALLALAVFTNLPDGMSDKTINTYLHVLFNYAQDQQLPAELQILAAYALTSNKLTLEAQAINNVKSLLRQDADPGTLVATSRFYINQLQQLLAHDKYTYSATKAACLLLSSETSYGSGNIEPETRQEIIDNLTEVKRIWNQGVNINPRMARSYLALKVKTWESANFSLTSSSSDLQSIIANARQVKSDTLTPITKASKQELYALLEDVHWLTSINPLLLVTSSHLLEILLGNLSHNLPKQNSDLLICIKKLEEIKVKAKESLSTLSQAYGEILEKQLELALKLNSPKLIKTLFSEILARLDYFHTNTQLQTKRLQIVTQEFFVLLHCDLKYIASTAQELAQLTSILQPRHKLWAAINLALYSSAIGDFQGLAEWSNQISQIEKYDPAYFVQFGANHIQHGFKLILDLYAGKQNSTDFTDSLASYKNFLDAYNQSKSASNIIVYYIGLQFNLLYIKVNLALNNTEVSRKYFDALCNINSKYRQEAKYPDVLALEAELLLKEGRLVEARSLLTKTVAKLDKLNRIFGRGHLAIYELALQAAPKDDQISQTTLASKINDLKTAIAQFDRFRPESNELIIEHNAADF